MKKSDDFHRVCLLQLHVNGRPPRPACRPWKPGKQNANRLTEPSAVTDWERPAAAAQDANRRSADWFHKAPGTHFLPGFPPAEQEKAASAGGKNSNHGLNDKPEKPWYPERVIRESPDPEHLDN